MKLRRLLRECWRGATDPLMRVAALQFLAAVRFLYPSAHERAFKAFIRWRLRRNMRRWEQAEQERARV